MKKFIKFFINKMKQPESEIKTDYYEAIHELICFQHKFHHWQECDRCETIKNNY